MVLQHKRLHYKIHFRPSENETATELVGPKEIVCRCNKSEDHRCPKSCRLKWCEHRTDGELPNTKPEEERLDFQAELDRHVPARLGRWGYADNTWYCKSWCGAVVHNQLKHFQYHVKDLDLPMRDTIQELFGDN